MNKQGTAPTPEPKKKLVATQKTFKFLKLTSLAKIDNKVNAWLLDRSDDGTPAQLGKTFSSTFFIYYVFLYSRKVDIIKKDENA